MKLASVEIRNFRAIEEMPLPLHPQLTVLHGENGLGKTSVLRAIAVGLNAIPACLPDTTWALDYREQDPRRNTPPADVTVTVTTVTGMSWTVRSGGGRAWRPVEGRIEDLILWMREFREDAGTEAAVSDLPVVAFYDTERAMVDIPEESRKIPESEEFPRHRAFERALAARAAFPAFFRWFYAMENQELREQRARADFEFRNRGLAAVREAICSVLDGASSPSIRVEPLAFEISMQTNGRDEILDIEQLSGGCRATLALAGDLAWRMAVGNPHRENPLKSEAVVLIDEIELHLHPSWQQRILDDLTRTFPNAQFIVTTHSPQVLTTVRPEQVVTLVREDGKIVPHAPGWGTYGAEAGDVLTAVMGVEERPRNEFSETLDQYRELIEDDRGETEEALALREKLDAWNRQDPDLVRADAAIRRRNTLRRMGRAG